MTIIRGTFIHKLIHRFYMRSESKPDREIQLNVQISKRARKIVLLSTKESGRGNICDNSQSPHRQRRNGNTFCERDISYNSCNGFLSKIVQSHATFFQLQGSKQLNERKSVKLEGAPKTTSPASVEEWSGTATD